MVAYSKIQVLNQTGYNKITKLDKDNDNNKIST